MTTLPPARRRLRAALVPLGLVVVVGAIIASAFWPHSAGQDLGDPAAPAVATTGEAGGSTPGVSGSAVSTSGASSSDPASIVGIEWELVDGTQGGRQLDSAGSRGAVLRFDGSGHLTGNDGCNYFGHDVTIGAGTLSVGPGSSSDAVCGRLTSPPTPVLDSQELLRGLQGSVTWAVGQQRLTLTTVTSSMVFDVAASIFPSVQKGRADPVLETGHHGTGDYRVSWASGPDGTIGLTAEWRESPGRQVVSMFGALGKDEWPASIWACDSFTIGADRYVYGFALAGTTTATVADAAGHTVGSLTVSSPGWAQDKVAYRGWVSGAAGTTKLVVTTRTATGEETKPACSVIH